MRPIEVSMTTVGPLGAIVTGTLAVGASGRSCAGGVAGGADCWASAAKGAEARQARTRVGTSGENLSFMPNLRVNHATGWMLVVGGDCIFIQ
jgi:hypothetical protein